jgi:hypothetical protein
MDLSSSPHDDAYRQEVRAFIRDHYAPEMRVPNTVFASPPSWAAVFKESWIPRSSIFGVINRSGELGAPAGD